MILRSSLQLPLTKTAKMLPDLFLFLLFQPSRTKYKLIAKCQRNWTSFRHQFMLQYLPKYLLEVEAINCFITNTLYRIEAVVGHSLSKFVHYVLLVDNLESFKATESTSMIPQKEISIVETKLLKIWIVSLIWEQKSPFVHVFQANHFAPWHHFRKFKDRIIKPLELIF